MSLILSLLIVSAQPLPGPEPEPSHWPHRVLSTNIIVDVDGHEDTSHLDNQIPADSEGPFTFCRLSADGTDGAGPINLVSTPVGPAFRPPTAEQLIGQTEIGVMAGARPHDYRCFTQAHWTDARAAIDAMRREREQAGEILWEIFWPAELLDR